LARAEPYRYADAYALADGPAPLIACLDSVTDPRNLGAVIRSAEGAGASGVVLPAHGSARVTAAVCRASAGAVEHLPVAVVKNLARYLGEVKGQRLCVWAADGAASCGAVAGRRGVVVFGGVGEEREHGRLEVRYAPHADATLELLAAEHRATETVCLVSSDFAVRGTSGQEVQKRTSRTFLSDL